MENIIFICLTITLYALYTWAAWHKQNSENKEGPLSVYIISQIYFTYVAVFFIVMVLYWHNKEFMKIQKYLFLLPLGLYIFFISCMSIKEKPKISRDR